MHIDWTLNPTNILVIMGAIFAAARWAVVQVRTAVHRLDLHERALIKAGWLQRNHDGELEIPEVVVR